MDNSFGIALVVVLIWAMLAGALIDNMTVTYRKLRVLEKLNCYGKGIIR